jgi:hypothetical protein
MAQDIPITVDVRSLYGEISSNPALSGLQRTIKRAMLYQSCLADLRQADSSLHALKKLSNSPRNEGSIDKVTTQAALLMQAVILYVRATGGNNGRGERGSVIITSKLTPELLKEHNLILLLRNRALAHVYHGEIIGDHIWSDQAIFLVEEGDAFRPSVTTRASQVNTKTAQILAGLLPIAIEIIDAKSSETLDGIVTSLNKHGVAYDLLLRHQIDLITFFGSEARARVFAASSKNGEASLIIT